MAFVATLNSTYVCGGGLRSVETSNGAVTRGGEADFFRRSPPTKGSCKIPAWIRSSALSMRRRMDKGLDLHDLTLNQVQQNAQSDEIINSQTIAKRL